MPWPGPDDEGRHQPEVDPAGWEESWDLDFTTADGALGGYVRLTLHPRRRLAWFWAAVVGRDRPLVTVVDHEVAFPRGPALDLRAEGLWTSLTCETPLEHWTVGLEAFGVALDDPVDALESLRGDRTALGLDLEWEAAGPATPAPHPEGYHLPAEVHGEVLVDTEVITFEGSGGWTHAWGRRRWDEAVLECGGRLDATAAWYVVRLGVVPPPGRGGLPGPGRVALDVSEGEAASELWVTPISHAPVAVGAEDGSVSRMMRSLCRYATADGRTGVGWSSWSIPER